MIEVTIRQRNSDKWSSVTIARTTALIVTSDGSMTDTDTDTAWQVIAYCNAHNDTYDVQENPS